MDLADDQIIGAGWQQDTCMKTRFIQGGPLRIGRAARPHADVHRTGHDEGGRGRVRDEYRRRMESASRETGVVAIKGGIHFRARSGRGHGRLRSRGHRSTVLCKFRCFDRVPPARPDLIQDRGGARWNK